MAPLLGPYPTQKNMMSVLEREHGGKLEEWAFHSIFGKSKIQ